MSKLIIKGGNRLSGVAGVHGAKNAVLPILCASLLCEKKVILNNCPCLSDTYTSVKILKHLGCNVTFENNTVTIERSGRSGHIIPDEFMQVMRSSILFMSSVSAKETRALLSYPGGCELGPRPINIHLKSLRALGLTINEKHGMLHCELPKKHFTGTNISLPLPSVGATENTLIAAVLAKGTTRIINAAREPEIINLADFLNKCGADISGAGSSIITINGVECLFGCTHDIIPDRIAAATYMACAAVTGGDITVKNILPEHIEPCFFVFNESGCKLTAENDSIRIQAPDRLNRIKYIYTDFYPGFPTDVQSPVMAMACIANGSSMFVETIFQNRYRSTDDLIRMGANIKTDERVALVEGVEKLYGARVSASDLRSGAAMIIAGLCAEGKTVIEDIYHIDRGYEKIEDSLSGLGADIIRIDN